MVRFRSLPVQAILDGGVKSQFHYGSIQITLPREGRLNQSSLVSIPLWFDSDMG